ncbi:uncharacterized protein G2W53_007416 [Senna tora]|uniref:Uncharacterized protein n=1 Tax=Senna tora TaxID=362788 RepID=A0A835CE76_9FABA|nr:uncharacterized protein G2W53_007416 [Senna tora]
MADAVGTCWMYLVVLMVEKKRIM